MCYSVTSHSLAKYGNSPTEEARKKEEEEDLFIYDPVDPVEPPRIYLCSYTGGVGRGGPTSVHESIQVSAPGPNH